METETIETKIREALLAELERQTGARKGDDDTIVVNGKINVDDLAVAVAGALAGGP